MCIRDSCLTVSLFSLTRKYLCLTLRHTHTQVHCAGCACGDRFQGELRYQPTPLLRDARYYTSVPCYVMPSTRPAYGATRCPVQTQCTVLRRARYKPSVSAYTELGTDLRVAIGSSGMKWTHAG
eukprot:2591557-Rhodomonas_salina.1